MVKGVSLALTPGNEMLFYFPKINLPPNNQLTYNMDMTDYLFIDIGKVFYYDRNPKSLSVEVDPLAMEKFGPKEEEETPYLKNALWVSKHFGGVIYYTGIGSEVLGILAVIFLLDNLHVFLAFSQLLKTLLVFRFTNVHFGDLLEIFMEDLEGRLDPKKIKNYDEYLMLRKGERGKLSRYKKPIDLITSFTTNLVAYLISWILKIIGILVINCFEKNQRIHKVTFYIVYYLKNLHFGLFSSFIASGAFYSTRAILHTKLWPSKTIYYFDKFLAVLSLFLCLVDFLELFIKVFDFTTYPHLSKDCVKKVEEEKEKFEKQIEELDFANNLPNPETKEEEDSKKSKLPLMVPISWVKDPQTAKDLGYKQDINHKKAIRKMVENQPSVKFSLANVSKRNPTLKEIFLIRVDGPI